MSGVNPGNVAGGHKANLNNPNTSEEAKQHSKEVLENNDLSGAGKNDEDKNTGNIIGGHKANLNNPNTSGDAKEHSKQVLNDLQS